MAVAPELVAQCLLEELAGFIKHSARRREVKRGRDINKRLYPLILQYVHQNLEEKCRKAKYVEDVYRKRDLESIRKRLQMNAPFLGDVKESF
jgi:hypothetical protein